MTGPFLRFDAVVLPPPWPATVALMVVLGVFWLGLQAARRLGDDAASGTLNTAAGFVFVTAAVAALVQMLALLGVATPGVLRVVGGALAAASVGLAGPAHRARAREAVRAARALFATASGLERWVLVASIVTVLALGLGALGPATDIDSLTYHLSVPLSWLAHGGVTAAPDWMFARMVGVGESLNLLGLAMGTDCLGSVLQVAGLLVALAAVAGVARSSTDTIFALAVVAGCPLLPFLALTSKPQLLPASATTVALSLLVVHRRTAFAHMRKGTLWLLFGCVAFAPACKYSFIPAGTAVAILAIGSLRRTPWVASAISACLVTFAVIALPVYVRNLAFYGDPVSPVFERFRRGADPVIVAFSWYLRNVAGGHSLRHLLRLPWDLVVATGPGQMTSVLGAGALSGLAAPSRTSRNWGILATATAVTLVGVSLGQLQARFFFEPYLWFGLAAVLSSWSLRKRWLFAALSLQMLATTTAAVFGAIHLFPAALSAAHRQDALMRFGADYALSRWLDGVLPNDAVVATDRGPSLFMPRPTIHGDVAQMIDLAPLTAEARRARLQAVLARGGADTLVVTAPPESSPYWPVVATLGTPASVSPDFTDAVRNPWKQAPAYKVLVYDLRAAPN